MSIMISPLNLKLDKQNPRFVVLEDNSEQAIRKYMSMYEDVCQLAEGINNNGGLLLGERIVIIQENNENIVMEGNRRTVALQFLLNRNLIPDGFEHKVPTVKQDTLSNINNIEVDIAPTRHYAIALMSKRHIEGVKQWKPLAKKQFFATMFMNGNSINELSIRTGIQSSDIRKEIRDYKLLLSVSKKYKQDHPEYDEDLITYKIDPFLRIFTAKQLTVHNVKKSPSELLKIKYDSQENTLSDLPGDMFEKILKIIFKATIVNKVITTRNTLFDVPGVKSLLETLQGNSPSVGGSAPGSSTPGSSTPVSSTPGSTTPGSTTPGSTTPGSTTPGSSTAGSSTAGGPTGGSPAGTFFEHVSWGNKLLPQNPEHIGLIVALDELYRMSNNFTRKESRNVKIYEAFPVGTGMLLRTAYEQALILQLKKTGLWNNLLSQYTFPMLSNIEVHVTGNINTVLPNIAMKRAFNQVITANSRDFLNSNIHNPGLIRTTSASLQGLASGGMLALIQLIIDNI